MTARDHDLPALREAPTVLLSYTMFLRVEVGLMPTGATMLAVRPPAQVWGVSRNRPMNQWLAGLQASRAGDPEAPLCGSGRTQTAPSVVGEFAGGGRPGP